MFSGYDSGAMTGKTCFVISPIGVNASPQRKRADSVLKHIFKPALEPLGYTVVRADEISQPGSITLQVLERVLESDLVIADLTDHNPNVFYELAVRHASERPVIHAISSEQTIPFDVADLRTVKIAMDLDGAEQAKAEIVAQAKEIEAGRSGTTPVKLAGVLKHLGAGKSDEKVLLKADEKVILKQILDGLTELRSDFRRGLERFAISNAESLFTEPASTRPARPAGRGTRNSIVYRLAAILDSRGDMIQDFRIGDEDGASREYFLETARGNEIRLRIENDASPSDIVGAFLHELDIGDRPSTLVEKPPKPHGSHQEKKGR